MGYDFPLSPVIIRALFRRLIIAGFTKEEAGNLIAKLMGLGVTQKGWTLHELIRLLYEEYRDKNPTPL